MNTTIREKHTLIVTATVHVNSDMAVLTDPLERERQCVESILYYLRSPYVGAMIICDNSGFDFSSNQRLKGALSASETPCEFLAFVADSRSIMEKGKGFGEGLMMEHVFRHSQLLDRSGPSIFKVTGRLLVLNFDHLARKARRGKTYFQPVGRNPFVNLRKLDTRCYYVNKENFRTFLLDAYRQVDDKAGYYLEHAYYKALQAPTAAWSRFGTPPLFAGISGSTGLSYSIGPVKRILEKILNRLQGGRF